MTADRFDRNVRFFGRSGQERLGRTTVAVVGAGGTGSHVIQQLAFLGVGGLRIIDEEELDISNRNRLVASLFTDPIPGTLKVDIAKRLVNSIDPNIAVETFPVSLITVHGFEAVKASDFVFGCVDKEGPRLVLAELCAAYKRGLFDVATDIEVQDQPRYGGRVCVALNGDGCPLCLGVLDSAEAGIDLGPRTTR